MPEDMPDRMPDRMPENMSDRMPEDLPVTKCINVMVGITRSKVIYFYLFLVAVHVIFPFVVCIWERAENLKQEDDKGAERLHP